ncbi:ADP-ribose pyrophosphatase, mitochondrial-like [Zerene cesonia]|uniref:ADP-ribose pyrophosphatase, mitochondrial-like n=1 Tax=Zerene cesonia TaxID=33412 RepID=UPI0018E588F3|nr:ADP-ribose pyrophosphatase, mitochondrial-like [Zerene cesonia]
MTAFFHKLLQLFYVKCNFLLLGIFIMARPGLCKLTHIKCRSGVYPRSNIERQVIPDDKLKWDTDFTEYKPPFYTAPSIVGKPWADPDIGAHNFNPKWNELDGEVDRTSYIGQYKIINKFPLNPIGRTGICGRGVLGRWGPNHAADPVVTRWHIDSNNKKVLQFIAIKRRDTGEWALPGGMVDPGEKVAATAIREFQEEAMNSLQASNDEKEALREKLKDFFSGGIEIYSGYVDDPRNTDNAWMETVAFNFHDDTGSVVGNLHLQAGDDAIGVRWVDVTPDLKLYASHKEIVDAVLDRYKKFMIK